MGKQLAIIEDRRKPENAKLRNLINKTPILDRFKLIPIEWRGLYG